MARETPQELRLRCGQDCTSTFFEEKFREEGLPILVTGKNKEEWLDLYSIAYYSRALAEISVDYSLSVEARGTFTSYLFSFSPTSFQPLIAYTILGKLSPEDIKREFLLTRFRILQEEEPKKISCSYQGEGKFLYTFFKREIELNQEETVFLLYKLFFLIF